ncbi:pyruvate dehydrogenase complex E1 component subunit beta [Aequorivita marina]|uniref:pyruvate dehydrogenase complex E1 component subunit beta n=1 Tax=Aequorivita marina TaxID=3073654 RepID=UPI002875C84B|nr:pyruvate dehydrogenase complex E1 component subunit beta [Aequorivita sp. S2608]MDS1297139.1 pyruvate dehydrogenase complex E1 component subunit beta [Aequorivita sp. S2608]
MRSMKTLQFREAIAEAMSEEMRRDETIYLMGEEVAEYNGAYKASKGMLDEFGAKRIIDTPISENGFSGIGVGSAMNGNRPIIEFMTFNFSLVAIDQIINNAAKMRQMSGGQFNIPIVFRGPTASAGQLAATHSQAFESWYANCPGLKVVVPSNPADAKGLLKAAIRDDDPVIFMESEQMYGDKGEVPEGEYLIPLGVADIKRKGTDVTIVSFGKIIKEAYKAAETLAEDGIECEVIDLRTVRPLDYKTIYESVKKTNRLVILEEAWPFGNVATEITYQVQNNAFDYLDAPIVKINTADTPAPYSPVLFKEWLPNNEDVVKAVKKVLYKD